jgi:DNA modification methylase
VTYVELSEDEERLVLATLDPVAAMAEAERDQLAALLAGLEPADEALRALLDDLGRDAGIDPIRAGLVDPDDVPDVPDEPTVQHGELYALGDHRLLCGDATEAGSYERLLSGERADMAFTDPPWNVAIGQDSNPRHRQRPGLINDALTPVAFASFLASFASHLRTRVRGDLYCVLGAAEWPTLDRTLRAAGLHWSATIIWAKDAFVLGRSNYHRRYEPLWYGWPDGSPSSYVGGRAQDDVWEIPRPRRSEEHPTMKPVELVARAIANSSVTRQVVLDPFAGSGTTLIAAEQTARRGYVIELDPRYAQVAIDRWERFSGRSAERLDG